MSRFRLIIILTILFYQLATAQKKLKVEEKIRVIEYYILSEQENSGFYRKDQELSRYVMEAALNNEITTYLIDYDSGTEELISPATLSAKLRKVNEPGLEDVYQAGEISMIGLDVTHGSKDDDQIYRQYNYLNLYVPYYHSASTTNIYLASFRFDEIIRLLDGKNALWYSENHAQSIGIFTNHSGHLLSESGWTKKLLEYIKLGHLNATFEEGVNISGYKAQTGYELDVQLVETKNGKYFTLDSIGLYKSVGDSVAGSDQLICSFSFEDYQNYLVKNDPDEISLMSVALINGKLSKPSEIWRNRFENFYDPNFKDREIISQNGRYTHNDVKDYHTSGRHLEPQKIKRGKISNQRFTVRQTDLVYTNRNENNRFRNLIESILNSAFNGSLNIYRDKSMLNKMPSDEFKSCFKSQSDAQLEFIYNLNFDIDGEKRSYQTIGIGILNSNDVAVYFHFDDVIQFLSIEQVKMLNIRNFTGILHQTSHISMFE
ncbi:MAG: hypothetical protein KI791_03570 [Cyclobacteriaceae bacterium]|nr:hypothetical protein [Cyclobacteriaceae bacterium SS2]